MKDKERLRRLDNKMQYGILNWILEKNKGIGVKAGNIQMRFVF